MLREVLKFRDSKARKADAGRDNAQRHAAQRPVYFIDVRRLRPFHAVFCRESVVPREAKAAPRQVARAYVSSAAAGVRGARSARCPECAPTGVTT